VLLSLDPALLCTPGILGMMRMASGDPEPDLAPRSVAVSSGLLGLQIGHDLGGWTCLSQRGRGARGGRARPGAPAPSVTGNAGRGASADDWQAGKNLWAGQLKGEGG
jgi:hypothetical protein